MGGKFFDFPKPVSLIKHLINFCTEDGDVVLDFFAGSGTTGQSVLELNQDNQNRKFILVQMPERPDETKETGQNAIAAGYKKISDITIERNKRVVEKLIEEKKKQQRGGCLEAVSEK